MTRFVHRHARSLAALLLVAMGVLLSHAALVESPTIDEPNHVTRGMAVLSTGDTRLSYAHPPLANVLQAIPGRVMHGPLDVESHPTWRSGWDVERLARWWLQKDYATARSAIVAARFVTILVALLLGIYLYRFVLPFGRTRALLTLALYAMHPLFLAHGHLATTDMPVTAAIAVAVGEFTRWMRTGSRWRLLTFALAAGAACATKFTGLVLAPLLGISGIVIAAWGRGPWANRPLHRRVLRFLGQFALAGAIALFVVNASYGFERTGWTVERVLEHPEPTNWITRRYGGTMLESLSPLPSLPEGLPIPLPYPFVFGLYSIAAQAEIGHPTWFWGEQEPSRLYFPTLAIIKTPAALLALLAFAAFLVARRRRRLQIPALALWAFPVLFFAIAARSEIQIGVRHILPVFPFLVVAAGWAATHLSRRSRAAAGALVALTFAEAVASAPAFLGHFSWAIGGPKVGHRISMVGEDWGQDVRALAEFVRAKDLSPLQYEPYGFVALRELRNERVHFRRFNCRSRITEPTWVAIHGARQVRRQRACGPIDENLQPTYKIREHIWIYRIEPGERPQASGRVEAGALAPSLLHPQL